MKVVTLFISQCAVIVAAQNQMFPSNNLPRIHDAMCQNKMDGIVFPDPDNCDAYVQCQRGSVNRMRCQSGTSFDLKLYFCVASHTVICGSRRPTNWHPSTPNEVPPSAESHHSICRNLKNGAMIANPSNCRAFIECRDNLRLDRECGFGELFEVRSGICLSDFAVDCGDRKIPTSSGDVAHRNVCAGQRNGARFEDARDCRRFVECQNQQPTSRECNFGELYDTSRGMCIFGNAVNCGARSNNNNNDLSLDSEGNISRYICSGLPAGTRISHPQDCRMFYECRQNQRFDMNCPANQMFDVASNQCRAASSVNCGSRQSTNVDAQQNAICQGQRNGRRLGNPLNCRAFIECQGNAIIDGSCENGQLFDPLMELCLPAHIVRCGTRGLPPSNEPQAPEDFFPPCPRTGVLFRSHPHDCQKYFICSDGTLIQHQCAVGIHFNPDSLQCDFPQNANCRSQRIVIPQTPILPDCSQGDFFPNLVNCKQYYICINKTPQLMNCPEGHLWDNLKLQCQKSDSQLCARSFNAKVGTFIYSIPTVAEKKS